MQSYVLCAKSSEVKHLTVVFVAASKNLGKSQGSLVNWLKSRMEDVTYSNSFHLGLQIKGK